MVTKKCSNCKSLKPLEVFNKDCSSKDGKTSVCGNCNKIRKRLWEANRADSKMHGIVQINDYFADIEKVKSGSSHYYKLYDKRLTTVTKLRDTFVPEFEKERIAISIATRENKTSQEVLDDWKVKGDRSIEKGNRLHDFIRDLLLGGVDITDLIKSSGQITEMIIFKRWWQSLNLQGVTERKSGNMDFSNAIEMPIGDYELGIGGTVDAIFYNPDLNALIIFDWKCSSKDLHLSYNNLNSPFQEFPDSNYIKFSIQLSLYKLIIERNVPDIKVGQMFIARFFGDLEPQIEEAYDLTNKLFNYLIQEQQENPILNDPDELQEIEQIKQDVIYQESLTDEVGGVYHRTSNLSQFKTMIGNRAIDKVTLDTLTKSIQLYDMLKFVPLLISSDMTVIDGQHRLEVARLLGLSVSYIIADEVIDIKKVIQLNAYRGNWKLEDYLNSYVQLGNTDYIKLKEFNKFYDFLNLSECIRLFAEDISGSRSIQYEFKKGNFSYTPKLEMIAKKIAGYISDYLVVLKPNKECAKTPKTVYFIYALKQLARNEGYDHQRCIKKLNDNPLVLPKKNSTREYLKALEMIQNHQRPEKFRIFFI